MELDNGGVDDDAQRRSVSRLLRITSAETRLCAAHFLFRTSCNHASTDGRATLRRSSACRNSCMDLPCRAAGGGSRCEQEPAICDHVDEYNRAGEDELDSLGETCGVDHR